MYNILSVVSYSGVGKTTLIEGIIKELNKEGYNVGVIKHTCHDFDIDEEGKDTYKHRKSGAKKVCIISDKRVAYIEELKDNNPLYEMIQLYRDMDLIIIEGYKNYRFRRLEITRENKYKDILSNRSDLIGIVSDIEYDLNIKQFDLNDYKNISNYIEYCIKNEILSINDTEIKKILKE
ncbi:molybdopterin-guanine dinucleotide biosynthesis protein B [Clostridioides difficile]|nr:molybdopterin-guanine dinucleotide biosynthesis protein B [Clostridioides difficile]